MFHTLTLFAFLWSKYEDYFRVMYLIFKRAKMLRLVVEDINVTLLIGNSAEYQLVRPTMQKSDPFISLTF